jgi:hypothetical protein
MQAYLISIKYSDKYFTYNFVSGIKETGYSKSTCGMP